MVEELWEGTIQVSLLPLPYRIHTEGAIKRAFPKQNMKEHRCWSCLPFEECTRWLTNREGATHGGFFLVRIK
jgi:hypothetical protein